MSSSHNLDALSQDAELPFGHPGRRFDDTPEGFEPVAPSGPGTGDGLHAGRIRQGHPLRPRGPPPVRLREHNRGLHRRPGPGGRLPPTAWSWLAEDLDEDNEHLGELPALPAGDYRLGRGGVAPDSPEALPVLREARMVTTSKDADARRTKRLTTAVFAVCYPTEMNVGAEDATDSFRALSH